MNPIKIPISVWTEVTELSIPIKRKAAGRSRRRLGLATSLILSLFAARAFGQTGLTLPVYNVTNPPITTAQVQILASSLNVPTSQLVVNNSSVSFLDPTKYLNIPTTQETDSTVINELLARTRNLAPAIPINVQRVDFQALNSLPVFGTNSAMTVFSNALTASWLLPQIYNGFIYGIPTPSYTMFNGSYNNGTALVSANHALDTEVTYLMYDQNGIPVIGPGIKNAMSFNGYGETTWLQLHVVQLNPGVPVQIISSNEAIARIAGQLPAGAQIQADLFYYVPFYPPWPPPPGCPMCGLNISTVIPYYFFQSTLNQTNPLTGEVSAIRLKERMIPATDDPAFVPTVTLSAVNPGGTQIVARVSVTGGTPPYYYSWAGTGPGMGSNSGPSIVYTPSVRLALPLLQMNRLSPGSIGISWTEPVPQPWIVQAARDLFAGDWAPITSTVQHSNGLSSVTLDAPPGGVQFFRLALPSPTLAHTENIGVTVTDANGVSVYASQALSVLGTIIALNKGNVGISYGTESPREPDFAVDRIGWQQGMGTFGAGGGYESFCWMGDLAWPGDFIEPNPPDTAVATPWVYGDADYANWGVNTASIVLNNTDGWPNGFDSSQPGATIAHYPTAALLQPSTISSTVVIGLDQNNSTINTHWYNINYNGSWTPDGPNDGLCWLAQDCCDVLDEYDSHGVYATTRWAPAFGGLHIMTGWNSTEQVGDGSFERNFALNMLGVNGPAQTVLQAWFNAAATAGMGHGIPAAMGPFGPNGISDYKDYYWGKGAVNPNILPNQVTGWWYVQNTLPLNPPH